MARQRLGDKKLKKLRKKLGLPIMVAQVRGNTDHRIDLFLEDHTWIRLFKDGTIERENNKNGLYSDIKVY